MRKVHNVSNAVSSTIIKEEYEKIMNSHINLFIISVSFFEIRSKFFFKNGEILIEFGFLHVPICLFKWLDPN